MFKSCQSVNNELNSWEHKFYNKEVVLTNLNLLK
jgi:hypothetical protein